jgi:5-methylcytosine-specific restriction endonuclease McrA
MTRSVDEWVAKTDDAAIPPRVKDRIFARCGGRCQDCRRELDAINKPEFDHIVSLINGGRHAEFNLQTLCKPCHAAKTRVDVAEKSRVYERRASNLGFTPRKSRLQSRGFAKFEAQRTATRPIRKWSPAIEAEH